VNLLTEHAFLIGSVIESLLLSWALAELISKLQSDQITSERHYQNILNKTGNRLAQALKIADKHKKVRDVFLKNISHELKTPLHSIQHVLDLALQGYQVNNELMHDANHSPRLISRHIDKLLLNTEMGVSNPDFKLEQVDIKPTLKVWHQDLYNECRVRGTQFSLNSNLVDWDILAGPVRPVYLLLTEVIFNAANLDVDSITLDFNILQDSGQLHIHFDIHDASYSPIIEAGELFQSEQDAVFINDLVALLGGHWDIEFEHPVIVADIYLPYFAVSKKKGSDHLPKQVLVVEDNEINQKVMRSMLSRMGIECEIAINGEDALNIQALRPVDIILMDCQMPVMDGFDTTVAIRSNVKRYQQPIIIAVSANSMELDKTRCLAVGMNDFIAKPVRMADLRNVLMRWEGIKPKRL
jgi:CheY-like chemotaxis protein